jgi:DNA repair exonuclease SbcCD nuclease subunit
MRFVHAADLHIDSPLLGLEKYEGAPLEQIRRATRRATENLVQLCLDEQVDLLVLAGDLYDDDWRDYSTGLFFIAQMRRLKRAGIQVVWIRGNHDAASKLTKHLRAPDNLRELSTRRPESVVFESLGCVVHGMGYPSPRVERDLVTGYPEPHAGLFNIGLLHTAVDGRPGHDRYAPCSLSALINKGYDYWALGHVHTREVLHQDPWVIFPGNLQGRHMRETGSKGATLVSTDGRQVLGVEHQVLDVVRWAKLRVDLTDASDVDQVLGRVSGALSEAAEAADGRLLAVRVELVGAARCHTALVTDYERLLAEVRSLALEVGALGAWVEKLVLGTTLPFDREALAERDDALGELVALFRELESDDEALLELASTLADLRQKLPQELWQSERRQSYDSADELRLLLRDAEQLLIPRLVASEGGT